MRFVTLVSKLPGRTAHSVPPGLAVGTVLRPFQPVGSVTELNMGSRDPRVKTTSGVSWSERRLGRSCEKLVTGPIQNVGGGWANAGEIVSPNIARSIAQQKMAGIGFACFIPSMKRQSAFCSTDLIFSAIP